MPKNKTFSNSSFWVPVLSSAGYICICCLSMGLYFYVKYVFALVQCFALVQFFALVQLSTWTVLVVSGVFSSGLIYEWTSYSRLLPSRMVWPVTKKKWVVLIEHSHNLYSCEENAGLKRTEEEIFFVDFSKKNTQN